MAGSPEEAVHSHFRRSRDALERAANDSALTAAIVAISDRLVATLRSGGKILLAGNGGSAADAQHIAAEFLSRFMLDRVPLAALALSTDTSVLTAIGNDFGFEHVFARQVLALGRRGDAFIGISTSGRSPNVLHALQAGREIGMTTIGFTGRGAAEMRSLCELVLEAPASETALVQQIHLTAAHAICGMVEARLFGKPDANDGPR